MLYWASGSCLLFLLAVLPFDPVVAAADQDLADRDLPAADLIVVLDGTPTRLEQAERYRQQQLQEPELLLILCPRAAPPPQPMPELLQGYDTATHPTEPLSQRRGLFLWHSALSRNREKRTSGLRAQCQASPRRDLRARDMAIKD